MVKSIYLNRLVIFYSADIYNNNYLFKVSILKIEIHVVLNIIWKHACGIIITKSKRKYTKYRIMQ